MEKELERLQCENERMKKALEEIANTKDSDVTCPENEKYPAMLGRCKGIALAALKQVNKAH